MIDGLPTSAAAALGLVAASGWGVVAATARLYFKGGLHPQATIDRMMADHEREMGDLIHDRDEWRAESRIKDTQIAEQAEQLRVVKTIGETTRATLNALNASLPGGTRPQESP